MPSIVKSGIGIFLALFILPGTSIAENQDRTRLRWSPPAQSEPAVVYVPSGYFSQAFPPDRDVILVMPGYAGPDGTPNPARGARRSDLQISGGRHVRLIGGDNGTGRLRFDEVAGSVFVEGVSIALRKPVDAINVSGRAGTQPDVYLQNIYVTGVQGRNKGVHADIFQPQGPIGALRVDRFTGDSNYQGFFVPAQFPILSADLSRVNLRFNDVKGDPVTYLFWFHDDGGPNYPVTLSDVWVAPRRDQAVGSAVWPRPDLVDAKASAAGARACWRADEPIKGCVEYGTPVRGDFVRSDIGDAYRSPGYLVVP